MNQIEQQKQYYEQRLDDLREKFQDALKDRNEFEAMQMKFQAMSSEYEERLFYFILLFIVLHASS